MIEWNKILNDIENTSSSIGKGKLLFSGIETYPEFEQYLRISFDKDLVLNIDSKTIEKALGINTNLHFVDIGEKVKWYITTNSFNKSLVDIGERKQKTFSDFMELYHDLINTRGDLAKTKLNKFFMVCDAEDAKWYARCLVKDLHSGFSIISVNKQLKLADKKPIKKFSLQLANPIKNNDIENSINKLLEEHKVLYSEPKRDGIRLMLRNTNPTNPGVFEALSRNGKPILNVDNLLYEAKRIFGNMSVELDGELIAKDFYTLTTTIHRKHDTGTIIPRKLILFDMLKHGVDLTHLPYTKRRKELLSTIPKDSLLFEVTESTHITTYKEAKDLFNDYIERKEEGSILKADMPYTYKREFWWKIKPVHTLDLKIIGFDYAKDGKWAGKRSSLIVTDKTERLKSHVGSGLSDDDISMFNIGEEKDWIGKIVEINFDSITPDKSLRFPRFVRLRDDKDEVDSV